jgi:mxaL protein
MKPWRSSPWLLAGAMALLGVSLLAPRLPLPGRSWQHVVMVDVTQSMNATDAAWDGQPVSRLEFARRALRQSIAAMPCGSMLGVGVFTEYRSLLLMAPVEVCSHYDELLAVFSRLDGRMAWAGASEVSRGVFSAMRVARAMAGAPSLVFISDGHEAPPLRPGVALQPEDTSGELKGAIVGVGGDRLVPIPKFDIDGHLLGVWDADEVMQADTASLGRTVGGAQQSLVDGEGRPLTAYAGSGTEHLSSLKEDHLRALALATRLDYRRVASGEELAALLRDPRWSKTVTAPRDARMVPLALALACLLAAVCGPLRRRDARAA